MRPGQRKRSSGQKQRRGMPPGKPKRQLGQKEGRGTLKRGARPKGTKMPAYVMPADRRAFQLDVEIGRHLLELPEALSMTEIMRYFRIDKKTFEAKARALAPILRAAEEHQIIDLLVEMGKGKKI